MRFVGALIQDLCVETRTGWSWMLTLSPREAPAWLAFHGPKGWRGDPPPGPDGEPRIELWPSGGASRPVVALPFVANQNFQEDLRRVFQQPVDPREGWLLLLGLLHALDEAARARPRVPTVGGALEWSGAPTLGAWASAMTLGDLEAALMRARPGAQARQS